MSGRPAPRKRTPVGPPPPPPAPLLGLAELVERHLTELAEVHRLGPVGLCAECVLPWPCHTRVMIDEALEAVRS